MKNLTFEEFRKDILDNIDNCPRNWRYGQKVFNYVEDMYDVARNVQYIDNIDCFYNDELVEPFIKCAYNEYVLKYRNEIIKNSPLKYKEKLKQYIEEKNKYFVDVAYNQLDCFLDLIYSDDVVLAKLNLMLKSVKDYEKELAKECLNYLKGGIDNGK